MSEPDQPRHDPLAALRQPNYALFAGGRLSSAIAMTLLNAAIAWQVYEISGSAFQLGMLGLARFFPSLGMSLVGGAVADSHDRKKIVLLAQFVPLACSATLYFATTRDLTELPLFYGLVLMLALAAAFENPARQALVPQVVSREAFPNAIVVNSTIQSLGFVTGPALGGLLIGFSGVDTAYLAHMTLMAASIAAVALLRPRAVEGARRAVSFEAIKEGVSFVRHRQVLLGAMTLDMFAVIFGGAQALLPIYAKDILQVGPAGLGWLAAGPAAGAVLMGVTQGYRRPWAHAGRAFMWGVAVFGVATVVFGLSRSFWLSLAALVALGAADNASAVIRQTVLQLRTPDALRGRVSAVNRVFISSSNELGAFESGVLAAFTGPVFAVVFGGCATLAIVALGIRLFPEIRALRRIEPG